MLKLVAMEKPSSLLLEARVPRVFHHRGKGCSTLSLKGIRSVPGYTLFAMEQARLSMQTSARWCQQLAQWGSDPAFLANGVLLFTPDSTQYPLISTQCWYYQPVIFTIKLHSLWINPGIQSSHRVPRYHVFTKTAKTNRYRHCKHTTMAQHRFAPNRVSCLRPGSAANYRKICAYVM